MSTTEHVALKPGEMISGYEVRRVMGGGGFGIVYEGYNHGLGRRAAIKEFFPHGMVSRSEGTVIITNQRDKALFERVLRRFEESTRVLARLDHPGIIKVLGYESRGGTAYMIMEYIEGETLREWTRSADGAPTEAELRQIFLAVADALAFVHGKGVLHRDISPDNIMIERVTGRPILIDFGALRQELKADSSHVSSVIVAREAYAPPEQLQRTNVPQGPWTDIFALAATMYETAHGVAAAPAGDRAAAILAGGTDPYVDFGGAALSGWQPRMAGAINRALHLAARDRPQSVAAFLADLGWRAPAAEQGSAVPVEHVTRPIPASEPQVPSPPTPPTRPHDSSPRPTLGLVGGTGGAVLESGGKTPSLGGRNQAGSTVPPLPPLRRRRVLYGILAAFVPVALGLAMLSQLAPEAPDLRTALPQPMPASSREEAQRRLDAEMQAERRRLAEIGGERQRQDQERARMAALERQREAEEALRRAEAQVERSLVFALIRDRDLQGELIDIHFSLDLTACRMRCERVPACVGFTLGPQGTCHTYSRITTRRTLAGYTAGERLPTSGGEAPPPRSNR